MIWDSIRPASFSLPASRPTYDDSSINIRCDVFINFYNNRHVLLCVIDTLMINDKAGEPISYGVAFS